MTANGLSIWGELIAVVGGGLILLIFSIFFSAASRQIKTPPGLAGRRTTPGDQEHHDEKQEAEGGETVRADGYIDSFAGKIEEAGGGPPLLVKIALVGIPLWWLLYMILNWSQSYLSIRTFIK